MLSRSCHSQMFFKIGDLKNFAIFTGKHLQTCNCIKKRLQGRCYFMNSTKFLRAPFCTEHLWWLLLHMVEQYFSNIPDYQVSTIYFISRKKSHILLIKKPLLCIKHLKVVIMVITYLVHISTWLTLKLIYYCSYNIL